MSKNLSMPTAYSVREIRTLDPSFADSFAFTLIIGADDFDEIELIVDAGGLAEAILPPGGLVFLLAGLLAIRFRPVVNRPNRRSV